MILPGYHHNYLKFYQLPKSNLFTHRMLFSREKPLVKSMAPGSIFYHIVFRLHFQKPKNTLLHFFFTCFILCSCQIYLSNLIQFNLSFYRGGIDNLSYALGCKQLFFVCMYHLYSVVWFSYQIDNLGCITGNTYRCCAASPFPLQGKNQRRYKLVLLLFCSYILLLLFWTLVCMT